MRVVGLHARLERRVDGAFLNRALQFLGRGERVAFGVDAERVADGVGRGLHPFPVGAVGAVGDAEGAVPWRDGVRLGPQLLGFCLIVCQHAIGVEIGVIPLDHRRKEVRGRGHGATENRLGDILTVDGMCDGLAAVFAFLALKMFEVLGNGEGRERRAWLADRSDGCLAPIGFQRGSRNGVKHIEIAGQQIRVGRVEALVDLEVDTSIAGLAWTGIGSITFEDDFLAALVRLQLVWTVAYRFLPIFLGILDHFGWHRQECDVSDLVQERRVGRFERNLQCGVIHHVEAG